MAEETRNAVFGRVPKFPARTYIFDFPASNGADSSAENWRRGRTFSKSQICWKLIFQKAILARTTPVTFVIEPFTLKF